MARHFYYSVLTLNLRSRFADAPMSAYRRTITDGI